jgi:hypothetical protein
MIITVMMAEKNKGSKIMKNNKIIATKKRNKMMMKRKVIKVIEGRADGAEKEEGWKRL